jgi:hypothetical protein
MITDQQIEAEVLACLAHRDERSSLCPSEIARQLGPADGEIWRELMPRVRDVAARLAREERVVITRGLRVLSPDHMAGGPIRIRRGKRFDAKHPSSNSWTIP